MWGRVLTAAVFAFFAQAASAWAAGSTTANLTVLALVPSTCSVASGTLNFGSVDPATGTVAPSLANISVTCALGTAFAVGLGDGSNFNSGRRLSSGGSYLRYELYKDLAATARFGDATTSERVSGQIGLGIAPNLVPVYGAIAGGQSVGAGSYSDSVLITVYY